MRVITLDSRVLHPNTIDKINNVPYFGTEKGVNGRGFSSNIYNYENRICLIDELCNPKCPRDKVLTIRTKQLSNLVAIFDQPANRYWVLKNRHTGREGWHTHEEFEVLVIKELNPVSFENFPK